MKICSVCGNKMKDGYCIGNGESYYCTDKCLHKDMTKEEYEELYEADEAYWTEWEANSLRQAFTRYGVRPLGKYGKIIQD